jgi:hypothetical protein
MPEITLKLSNKNPDVPEWAEESRKILRNHLAKSIHENSNLFDMTFNRLAELNTEYGMKISGADMCRISDIFKKDFSQIENAVIGFNPDKNEVAIKQLQGINRDLNIKPEDLSSMSATALKKLKASSPSRYKRLMDESLKSKQQEK